MPIDLPTYELTLNAMRAKLGALVPEVELKIKAQTVLEINHYKKARGAIILGHNYMEPALFHTVPDITGDSLELSRQAAKTERDPIVFCGVRFMAETAKILNPQRTVLLPARRAGCSLAESVSADDVRNLRKLYPKVPIVAYINTYADVKAEVDLCCTSGNAAKVVESLNSDTVIFLPDEYLAKNVAQETGKSVLVLKRDGTLQDASSAGSQLLGWQGRCEVHEKFTTEDINNVRQAYPDVVVVAHPECSPEVVQASDFSSSTSRMTKFVRESNAKCFLILTECSMGDNIIAENPDKEIVRMCNIRCPHMNEITLDDTLKALRDNVQVIDVPEPVRSKARRSLERMLEIG